MNDAGGEFVLDQRVRRGGSHHQKLVVIQRTSRPGATTTSPSSVASISRTDGNDDARHLGDPQAVELDDERYGDRPPWHDIQLELTGRPSPTLAQTFRERWEDPTPARRRNPFGGASAPPGARATRAPDPLPPPTGRSAPGGTHAVQVLRTYPARAAPYPFAPDGERSIARAYLKAFGDARDARLPRGPVPLVARRTPRCCRRRAARATRELRCVARRPALPRPGRAASSAARAAIGR